MLERKTLQAQIETQLPWVLLGAVFFFGLLLLAAWLFEKTTTIESAYLEQMRKSAIQLAIIVLVGGILKAVIDWRTKVNDKTRERIELRKEFLHRIRLAYVSIWNGQVLLIAHRDINIWLEELQKLIAIRPQVEEIEMDLKVSIELLKEKDEIQEGLEVVNTFLEAAEKEYINHRQAVLEWEKTGNSLDEWVSQQETSWTKDFLSQAGHYQKMYDDGLTLSKWNMRKEIYG